MPPMGPEEMGRLVRAREQRELQLIDDEIHIKPNPTNQYYYDITDSVDSNFTLLIKWVLMARDHPELNSYIIQLVEEGEESLDMDIELDRDKYMECGEEYDGDMSGSIDDSIVNHQTQRGKTALMFAVWHSNLCSTLRIVEILLQHGTDPNIKDMYGKTALHYASEWSNCDSSDDTVALLLKYNANPNIKDNDGHTPVFLAAKHICSDSSIGTLRLLLDHGGDPNTKDKKGFTPITLAYTDTCNDTVYEAITLLIERGADLDVVDNHGRTPVMLLFRYHNVHKNLLELFLNKGADVNVQNLNGNTVLHIVFTRGLLYTFGIVDTLLKHNADPNITNALGNTPFMEYFRRKYGVVWDNTYEKRHKKFLIRLIQSQYKMNVIHRA